LTKTSATSSDDITTSHVARKTLQIFPLMGRLFEANMRTTDDMSPVHFHVLTALTIQHRTLGELAERLNVTAASMSRTVTVMEERGWLERSRSKEDRRVVYIEITPAGYGVLREVGEKSEEQFAQVFVDLSSKELGRLVEGLDILIDTFERVIWRENQKADAQADDAHSEA
jgi:DNA-binding MarR family transcriptional regulator